MKLSSTSYHFASLSSEYSRSIPFANTVCISSNVAKILYWLAAVVPEMLLFRRSNIKIMVLWDVTPRSLIHSNQPWRWRRRLSVELQKTILTLRRWQYVLWHLSTCVPSYRAHSTRKPTPYSDNVLTTLSVTDPRSLAERHVLWHSNCYSQTMYITLWEFQRFQD
jgi:hypothetical protein